MKNKIEAEKVLFKELFDTKFWFVVPEYQRSYVWQKDNVHELLTDLLTAFEEKPKNDYFLGSLVLKNLSNDSFGEYEVLDGQQRLTTFFILMAVIRDLISDDDSKIVLQKTIYQKKNKIAGIPQRVRITYNIRDNVSEFIEKIIVSENGTTNDSLIHSFKDKENISIQNMISATCTIKTVLQTKTTLAEFAAFIFQQCLFIYVSTESSEDAFRLFTILNDRGVPLTHADILKSENIGALTSQFSDLDSKKRSEKIRDFAKMWEELEARHNDKFDRFLNFIRTIYIKEKAQSNLLEEFNNKIYNSSNQLLQRGVETFEIISEYDEIYDCIINLTNVKSNEYKNLITIMKVAYHSNDWIPPILYYYKKYHEAHLVEFLKKIEYKYTSDWVCGITPTLRLESMNKVLRAIENSTTASEVINNTDLFSHDQKMEDHFKSRLKDDIYHERYSKFIALKLDFLLSSNDAHIADHGIISLEHVLPQNPHANSKWRSNFSDEEHKYWKDKIANLVLLSRRKNSSLGNLDFEDKREKYFNTRMDHFKTNKVFLEKTNEWSSSVLEKRQKAIIEVLTKNIPISLKDFLKLQASM